MWTWVQRSGFLYNATGELVATGYAGSGSGKNNPSKGLSREMVPNVGPVPAGRYFIGPPYDTDTHGPYVLRLTPDAHTEMYRRSGFLIHGDSIKNPGTASKGCIILPKAVRQQIWRSGDHEIRVVAKL
jgi:hypothetical protein